MSLRIVITTTLNRNLFRAKLEPLVRARSDLEVIVVTDQPGPEVERVRWVWPKGWLRIFGRLGGRLLLLAWHAWHPRTKLVMAYNVVPHGLFADYLSRLRRLPVYLHFIGGPGEIYFAGNPAMSDNRLVHRSRHRKRLERWALRAARRSSKLFVPGGRTEQLLIGEGVEQERIVRLHSTIDLTRFYAGFEPRDLDVIVSAQLRERKRPRFTLQVFAEILKARPATRFCWLGDGPLHAEFEQALLELNLKQSVEWTATDEVASFYRRSRVFLLCSINEGLSLACMEAMACGCVPVTADVGDMGEVVRPGETGRLLSPAATISEYAAAVLTFLENEELWSQNSSKSIELIRREHSFDSATEKWRALLNNFPA